MPKKCKTSPSGGARKAKTPARSAYDHISIMDAASEYFSWCDSRTKTVAGKSGPYTVDDPRPYTIEGLCCFLDITTATYYNWKKQPDDLGAAVERIHQRIIANRVEGALDGRQHAGMAQFMLKNNDPEHYREKIEVANTIADGDRAMLEAWSSMWKVQEQLKALK
jgi:hypothetical protein